MMPPGHPRFHLVIWSSRQPIIPQRMPSSLFSALPLNTSKKTGRHDRSHHCRSSAFTRQPPNTLTRPAYPPRLPDPPEKVTRPLAEARCHCRLKAELRQIFPQSIFSVPIRADSRFGYNFMAPCSRQPSPLRSLRSLRLIDEAMGPSIQANRSCGVVQGFANRVAEQGLVELQAGRV